MLRPMRFCMTSPSLPAVLRSRAIVRGSMFSTSTGLSSSSAPSRALRKKGRSRMRLVPNSFQAATAATGVPSGYLAEAKKPTWISLTDLAFLALRIKALSFLSAFNVASHVFIIAL